MVIRSIDTRKVGIALTTYNRFELTIASFANVLDDPRVEEIAITDDCSTDDSFEKLQWLFHGSDKVKLFQNEVNLNCYAAKYSAMDNATSAWCVLLDSDNVITSGYLDALYAQPDWAQNTIYQPVFAKPAFRFTDWSGLVITRNNVARYTDTHLMTSLNAMNFFINREEYLKVWDGTVDPGSSDSIFFSFTWLCAGNSIYMCPDLQYDHLVGGGHYDENSHKYREFHKDLMQKIRELK